MTVKEFANLFDHTVLKSDATYDDFRKLCKEAKDYEFKMVAINSYPVAFCKDLLKGTDVHVGAAIGFPLGQTTIETKVFETKDAIINGCDEIDYVINITKLKEKDYDYIKKEMQSIVDVCREKNIISKVIFENCLLSEEEKIKMCEIALEVLPDFIKTSTGFSTSGATVEDVKLMKSIVQDKIQVKAAGGVRDLDYALKIIEAGATRIGSSASVKLTEDYKKYLESK